MSILRMIPSQDRFEIAVQKADSQSWEKGVAARIKPSAAMDVYRDLPDSLIAEILATSDHEARVELLKDHKPSVGMTSAFAVSVDAFVGWLRFAGGINRSDSLLRAGIFAVPDTDDTVSEIERLLTQAGLNPADFADAVASDDDGDDDGEGEPEGDETSEGDAPPAVAAKPAK